MSHERTGPEELRIVLDRMWSEVLPTLTAQADVEGYGPEWRAMCTSRAEGPAMAAAQAAEAAGAVWASVAAAQAGAAAAAAARATEWSAWVAAASQAWEAGEAARRAMREWDETPTPATRRRPSGAWRP